MSGAVVFNPRSSAVLHTENGALGANGDFSNCSGVCGVIVNLWHIIRGSVGMFLKEILKF